MKVLDRNGKEIRVGDKIAWVATSYGGAYLKIGNVVSIDQKLISSHPEQHYDYQKREWIKSGKTEHSYEVIVKADILHPYDLDKRYIARMPESAYGIEGEEAVCKVRRAEKI